MWYKDDDVCGNHYDDKIITVADQTILHGHKCWLQRLAQGLKANVTFKDECNFQAQLMPSKFPWITFRIQIQRDLIGRIYSETQGFAWQ